LAITTEKDVSKFTLNFTGFKDLSQPPNLTNIPSVCLCSGSGPLSTVGAACLKFDDDDGGDDDDDGDDDDNDDDDDDDNDDDDDDDDADDDDDDDNDGGGDADDGGVGGGCVGRWKVASIESPSSMPTSPGVCPVVRRAPSNFKNTDCCLCFARMLAIT
jgi:hypothetical protein